MSAVEDPNGKLYFIYSIYYTRTRTQTHTHTHTLCVTSPLRANLLHTLLERADSGLPSDYEKNLCTCLKSNP